MNTHGPAFDETLDGDRLRQQHVRIRNYMSDGQWRTLYEISEALGYPEASVSAQLRHLRKPMFGAYRVDKRRIIGGLWEYHVAPQEAIQEELFAAPQRLAYH
jgi:DNA-binding transcriptional regulator GbsR (MarR family)